MYEDISLGCLSLTSLHSLSCLGLSLALLPHFPEGLAIDLFGPPLYSQSLCHYNFLLTASAVGPGGWILSQLLNWVNYSLDSGINTCGLDFKYDTLEDIKHIDEKTEEHATKQKDVKRKEVVEEKEEENCEKTEAFNKIEDQGEDETKYQKREQEEDWQENKEEEVGQKKKSTIQQDILDFLVKDDGFFESKTGR